MTDYTGKDLGHYRLIQKLGSGSFADVYQAEHTYLNTPAAVKLLKNLASGDMQNFHNEARIIARLIHPHIVRVLDFGVEQSLPYLVMEYAPNGTLRQRHSPGTRLPLSLIVTYVKQISSALAYAHKYRLIHRDVKPENLLIGRNNQILLGDFGAALATRTSLLLSIQDIIGTLVYMAPEQLQGRPSPASDQYSLAIVVYEWLCGRCPFQGSSAELHHLQLYAPPPPLLATLPTLSSTTEQVVMKALAKQPEQRYSTVEAFAYALEESSKHIQIPPLFLPGNAGPHNQAASLATEILIAPSLLPSPSPIAPSLPITPLPETIFAIHPDIKKNHSRRLFLGSLAASLAAIGGISLVLTLSAQKPPPSHPQTSPTHIPTSIPTKSAAIITYTSQKNEVFTVAWSPDSKYIASAGGDACNLKSTSCTRQGDMGVHIWRALTGVDVFPAYLGHSKLVRMIAWSPDGKLIASASEDKTVEVWEASLGNNPFTYTDHQDQVCAVAWSPDNLHIASAGGNIFAEFGGSKPGDTGVHLWMPYTTDPGVIYPGHSNLVKMVAWSPDGKLIASADIEGKVNIWDPDTLQTLHVLPHKSEVGSLAWSPNSKYLVTGAYGSDDGIKIWNIGTESNIQLSPGISSNQVYTVAWSSDNNHIAAGYESGEIKVWRYDPHKQIGTQILSYRGHNQPVMSVQWSYDGRYIASAGFDKTVRIWTLS